jgi:putative CRISPR-associated protein (TIGR02619 family)
MRDVLICTVGLSLKKNRWEKYFNTGDSNGLVKELANLLPSDKDCGAEINSVDSIMQKLKDEKPSKMYLLASDTKECDFIGEVLAYYFRQVKNFEVKKLVIEKLTEDAKGFLTGLKNFVNKVSEILDSENPDRVIINATGGFKAQIAFATVIGTAFGIPVYYQFEDFKNVIKLHTLPTNWDINSIPNVWELVKMAAAEKGWTLKIKDTQDTISKIRYEKEMEAFRIIFDKDKIDGEEVIALTPFGLLLYNRHGR